MLYVSLFVIAILLICFIGVFISEYLIPHYILNLSEEKQLAKVNNDKTSLNILEILSKSKYKEVKKAIALCSKFNNIMFVNLFFDNDKDILLIIAGREDISPEFLDFIYKTKGRKDKDLYNILSRNKALIEYEIELQKEVEEVKEILKNNG